jgi:nicotinamide-nucleotide amidase
MPGESLEVSVGKLLRQRGLRLAMAESCTGGLIGHRLTNVPGSSTYYMGSVTAYSYEAKVRMLGVRWETLEKFGAVSQETVLEMARGVRQALAADVGVSVSGIAGPGGGTPEKPVGLVWFGLSGPGVDQAWSFIWKGDRLQVKEQSAEQALRLLSDYLEGAQTVMGEVDALGRKADSRSLEPVEVMARFDAEGQLMPVSFSWQGQAHTVSSTGRRWQDDTGQHVLVMGVGDKVFELVYAPAEMRWYVRPPAMGREFA